MLHYAPLYCAMLHLIKQLLALYHLPKRSSKALSKICLSQLGCNTLVSMTLLVACRSAQSDP